jgi:type IV secretion system protein VirB2
MNLAALRALVRPTPAPETGDHGRRALPALAAGLLCAVPTLALAQGFTKVATTVTNVNAILVTISVGVVTISIIWAGFKMIFAGARLADVANVLIGGTLVGGAAAFAAFIVN